MKKTWLCILSLIFITACQTSYKHPTKEAKEFEHDKYLVGEDYWRQAVDLEFLVAEGVIDPEDRELLWFAETAQEIWDGILHWYQLAGEPLFPAT